MTRATTLSACVLTMASTVAGNVVGHCDPQEVQKLLASNGAPGDRFGNAVAMFDKTAIVAAIFDDAHGTNSGAAYIFKDSGHGWTEITKLTAPGSLALGMSVAIGADTALVGAPFDNDNGEAAGAVYVFRETESGAWIQIAKLVSSDGAKEDRFGRSVAISGDWTIIGAWSDDDNGGRSGSAYIFRRTGNGTWIECQKLVASDGASEDHFGLAVAISRDTAVVGAPSDDDRGANSGSAYVFRDDRSGNWIETAKLTASNGAADDRFGDSVSISDGTAIIGAALGDGNEVDSGVAYVFRDDGSGNWSEVAFLAPPDGAAGDRFGHAVSIDGATAVVSAPFDDNDNGLDAGAMYVFRSVGDEWKMVAKVTPRDADGTDFFGDSVALSGDSAIVGAPFDEDSGVDAGSAYVFDLNCAGPCSADVTAAEVTFGSNEGSQDPGKLTADDDDRTIASSKVFLSALEPNLAVLEVTGDLSACLNPSATLILDVQDQASQPNVTVRVRLHPADGGPPVQVGQYGATFNVDSDHSIVVSDADPFIDPNGGIVLELRYSTVALLSPLGFHGRTDVVAMTLE